MSAPLMPKATAIWLIENTSLTFQQIADYCHLHLLEIQGIADGDIAAGMAAFDPIAHGQLSWEEIERCSKDPSAQLQSRPMATIEIKNRPRGGRYTPLVKRQDKPDAISWLLKHHPELSDAQICRLLGTTKPTIQSIRTKSHWNAPNIRARNPVELGLCNQQELTQALEEVKK